MGIEPILSAWKAEVLAIIRMAQKRQCRLHKIIRVFFLLKTLVRIRTKTVKTNGNIENTCFCTDDSVKKFLNSCNAPKTKLAPIQMLGFHIEKITNDKANQPNESTASFGLKKPTYKSISNTIPPKPAIAAPIIVAK